MNRQILSICVFSILLIYLLPSLCLFLTVFGLLYTHPHTALWIPLLENFWMPWIDSISSITKQYITDISNRITTTIDYIKSYFNSKQQERIFQVQNELDERYCKQLIKHKGHPNGR